MTEYVIVKGGYIAHGLNSLEQEVIEIAELVPAPTLAALYAMDVPHGAFGLVAGLGFDQGLYQYIDWLDDGLGTQKPFEEWLPAAFTQRKIDPDALHGVVYCMASPGQPARAARALGDTLADLNAWWTVVISAGSAIDEEPGFFRFVGASPSLRVASLDMVVPLTSTPILSIARVNQISAGVGALEFAGRLEVRGLYRSGMTWNAGSLNDVAAFDFLGGQYGEGSFAAAAFETIAFPIWSEMGGIAQQSIYPHLVGPSDPNQLVKAESRDLALTSSPDLNFRFQARGGTALPDSVLELEALHIVTTVI